jgi:antitoxin ParD1/3/4
VTKSYRLTLAAQQDLQDIWLYIAQDNPPAADRVEAEFYDAFEKLVEMPLMGHRRDDLTKKPVRFWNIYRYQIVYDPDAEPLLIIRLLSSYRDIAKILGDATG